MLIKDLAICIRTIDYSETSQIVTLFTRKTGKLSAIAKGSKRPKSTFEGPIEILCFGEIVFSDSNKEKLATLTEFQQQTFRHIADDLVSLNYCLFTAELLDKLTSEYDPHPELFDRVLSLLKNINEQQAARGDHQKSLVLLIKFELGFLREIGLLPVLDACVNCKSAVSFSWPQGYFSNSASGLICSDCEASFPDRTVISSETLNCLSNLKRLTAAGEKTLNEIESILVSYLTHILGRKFKMAKYILRA
jgi:DNA repair protein RecO (recombination protein O)